MARQAATGKRTPIHTVLPAAPVDGQEIRYLADAANGIVWTLRYRAASASAYKWEFVGGTDLFAEYDPDELSNSATYVSGNPTIVLPLAGDYDLEIGARIGVTATGDGYMSYAIGATAAVDTDAYHGAAAAGVIVTGSRMRRKLALASGVTIASRFRAPTGNPSFGGRWMRARPVRLG